MARRETAAGAASGRCARSYLSCRFRRGSGTDGLPGFPGNRDRVSRRPCGKRRHAACVCGRLSRDPSLPRGAHRLPIWRCLLFSRAGRSGDRAARGRSSPGALSDRALPRHHGDDRPGARAGLPVVLSGGCRGAAECAHRKILCGRCLLCHALVSGRGAHFL